MVVVKAQILLVAAMRATVKLEQLEQQRLLIDIRVPAHAEEVCRVDEGCEVDMM
jgi:hypothetical protein